MAHLAPSLFSQKLAFLYTGTEQLEEFARRSTIPYDRPGVWQIQTGLVRTLTWDPEGTVSTLGIWGPGDIVGQHLSQVEPYMICCLEPVEAMLLQNRTQWSLDALLNHTRQTQMLLQIVRVQCLEHRLLQLLEWLAQRFGIQTDRGMVTDIQMTHQEIAETIGSSRVTVTRLLRVLEGQEKIVRSRKRYLLIQS